MGNFCNSLFVGMGCECCKTGAQKRAEEGGKINEVAPSGKIGAESSAISTEYCNKYSIDSSRVAQWLDDHCTTTSITQFVQSSDNGGGSNKALILKENEIDMIIVRCRNIDNGYENDAERIDNDSYGNDDQYLTSVGWQMLCNLIESNSNTLRVIYFEGIFITKGRMQLLCDKLNKCNAMVEISFTNCSINFDKNRHVKTVKDASDSQGREIEVCTYDGALMMLEATQNVESLLLVKMGDKETVSPEFERQIEDLIESIKKRKKTFQFVY